MVYHHDYKDISTADIGCNSDDHVLIFNSVFDGHDLKRILDTNYLSRNLGANDHKSDLDVHDKDELDDIDKGKSRRHEQSHPHSALCYHFQ